MDPKELQPIFDYLDEFKSEVNQRFDSVEKRLDNVESAIHALAKEVKDFRDEHIVLYRKIEVLESWAKKVADKLGIPLPF